MREERQRGERERGKEREETCLLSLLLMNSKEQMSSLLKCTDGFISLSSVSLLSFSMSESYVGGNSFLNS